MGLLWNLNRHSATVAEVARNQAGAARIRSRVIGWHVAFVSWHPIGSPLKNPCLRLRLGSFNKNPFRKSVGFFCALRHTTARASVSSYSREGGSQIAAIDLGERFAMMDTGHDVRGLAR